MIQPTVTPLEPSGQRFAWGDLTIDARNVRRTSYGLDAELQVVGDDGRVLNAGTVKLSDPRARAAFEAGLVQRDGQIKDWPDRMLIVYQHLTETAGNGGARAVIVDLNEIEREEVRWRWPGYLPQGKIGLVDGDPGVGKSWLLLAIATAITRGLALPGDDTGSYAPSRVLYVTAEDGLADTIRPRAEDMGADLGRLRVLKALVDGDGQERSLNLAENIEALDEALADGEYAALILDPINAFLGSTETHRDAAIRAVLTPLARLAERHGVAILCIRHLTKGDRPKAIYRGNGTIGYTAAARVVWLVGQNPDDESERVVTVIKCNLAPFPSAYAFEIAEGGQFRWRGETMVTAAALLRPDADSDEGTRQGEAEEFLEEALGDGERPAVDVTKEAQQLGISEPTLKRARHALGIEARREGTPGQRGGGRWLLKLPAAKIKEIKAITSEDLTPLTENESKAPVQPQGVDPLNRATAEDERIAEGTYCLSLAGELGYPSVEFRPGHRVRSGEDAWRTFVHRLDLGAIRAAIDALDRHGQEHQPPVLRSDADA